MKLDKEQVSELLKEHSAYLDKKEDKYIDWFKHIITIAVALLAILISLKTGASTSIYQKYLFSISIVSLGLGILLGIIALYSEVHLLRLQVTAHHEVLTKLFFGETGTQTLFLRRIYVPKVYLGFLFLVCLSYIVI